MKKWILLSAMLGAVALSTHAQDDDMYFVPTKKNVASERATYGIPTDTYYSGSQRSVDEYNRRWASSYEVLPPDTGDIISFAGVEGIYPDSLGDFSLTQRMTRFDGYEPSAAYWAGYSRGYSDSWGWHSPWYYSYYPWYDWYYDPWYYDSWYWGGWYGWYGPWYRGYYGWYDPWYYGGYYYGGGGSLAHSPGTANHGRVTTAGPSGFASGRTRSFSAGTFGSSRSLGSSTAGIGNDGGTRSTVGTGTRSVTRTNTTSTYSNSNGNFGGSYTNSSSSSSFGNSRSAAAAVGSSSSSGSYSGGGGSFGGSRSSGGGGGGGSRSGGGGFGSGRR